MVDDTKPIPDETPPASETALSTAIDIKDARTLARATGLIAAAFAVAGIVAGVFQRGDLALGCIPVFVVFGAIANMANQNARRLAKETPDSPSVARQVGEGILGTFLALFLLAVAVIIYFFYRL